MGDAGERLKRATSRLAGAFGRLRTEGASDPRPGADDELRPLTEAAEADPLAGNAIAHEEPGPLEIAGDLPAGMLADLAAEEGQRPDNLSDEEEQRLDTLPGEEEPRSDDLPGDDELRPGAPSGGHVPRTGGAPMGGESAGGGGRRVRLIAIPWELLRKSAEDRLTGLAAESAFFAVLSLFPGLLVLAAALGWLDRIAGQEVARRSQAAAVELFSRVLTDQATTVVEAVHDLFARQRGGVLTSALVFGIWALSRAFAVVIRALDRAYGLHERRSWLNLRLTAILLSLGSALVAAMLLAMVAVGPFLGHDRMVAKTLGVGKAFALTWDWVRSPLVFAVVVIWTATLYHLAPNRRAPWARDVPGASIAAALWLLVSLGFGTYLHLAARFNQIFGVLGGGMILMLWLYLLCLSLFLGGELNAVLLKRAGIERRAGRVRR